MAIYTKKKWGEPRDVRERRTCVCRQAKEIDEKCGKSAQKITRSGGKHGEKTRFRWTV